MAGDSSTVLTGEIGHCGKVQCRTGVCLATWNSRARGTAFDAWKTYACLRDRVKSVKCSYYRTVIHRGAVSVYTRSGRRSSTVSLAVMSAKLVCNENPTRK
jgi:hypothetical protein